jgi:hypothetical protein
MALGARIGLLRPDLVPARDLVWIVACWTLTVVAVVIILFPGSTDGIVARQAGSSGLIGLFMAPLGIRVFLLGAAALLAGTLVLVLRRSDAGAVARELGLAVAAVFPTLALLADRQWALAGIALVLAAAAEVIAHRPAVRGTDTAVAVLATATWGVLLVEQFVAEDAADGWTWIALFGFAAVFAAFGSYYGVARAAESRSRRLQPLFRDDLPPAAVVGIVAVVVVLTALRLTVARDLFPTPDPRLWTPLETPPISWLHAALVAGLVVVLAARSVRHPLRRSQERRMTAALAVAGNAELAAGVAVILAGMVISAASGDFVAPGIPSVVVAALKFGGVVVITAVALLPAFRGTVARTLALITGAYLVPLTLQGLLREGEPDVVGFAATPVQVALLLLAVAVVGVVFPAVRRMLGSALTVRLAVVPFVAVHAGWLLPAAWTDLGRIVLVVGVVLALLFLLPPLAADRERHALDLLGASAGQLLALVVFLLALPSFLDDPQLVVLGLFWLSVAVVAALTVRTAAAEEPAASG